jgi:glycosyltransferase 2 family protein
MIQPLPLSNRAPFKSSVAWSRIRTCRRWLLGVSCLALAWHALDRVPWTGVWGLLARIGPSAVAILLVINLLMLPLMTARWWLLLRTLGSPVGLPKVCTFRTAVNAINYLTPGPHFGGEPFSVFLLHHRHGVPLSPAVTSVALDRLLELLASMVVLTFCLGYPAVTHSGPMAGSMGLFLATGVLAIVLVVLTALFTGRRPLSRFVFLFKRCEGRYTQWIFHSSGSLADTLVQGEAMTEALFRRHRFQFLLANFFSLGHWFGVFAEFWLMSALLGSPLSFWQLTAVVAVARLAFFTPLPAGIGVLESALPWVAVAVGQDSVLGVSLCLIIRLRDILFSLAGLGLATWYVRCCRRAGIVNDS